MEAFIRQEKGPSGQNILPLRFPLFSPPLRREPAQKGLFTAEVGKVFWFLYLVPSYAEYSEGMEAYRKAWAAYSVQRFDEAERWARIAFRADPQNAHALALQGSLYYLRHDLTSAKEAWERAMSLNPQLVSLSDQIAQVEAELRLEQQLQPASVGSLTIRVPAALSPGETTGIVGTLSQAMNGLEPYFQYRMSRPLTVLVYPPEFFYGSTHLPTEVLGLFDGKIRIPLENQRGQTLFGSKGSDPFVSVLWHEYAHAVVYDVSHGKAPRWLHEGLAQVCEKLSKEERLAQGERAPPLRTLLGIAERPGEPVVMPVGQFYSASESLVRYLLETWGWDRMRLFLKMLGAGQSVEEAIQGVYGSDLDILERKWRSS